MNLIEKYKNSKERVGTENYLFVIVLTFIALFARWFLFPIQSGDMNKFLLPWYNLIKENGGFKAVGMDIGDYMPTYYYIIAFLTYLPIKAAEGIKIVSCIADVILALLSFKVVYHITESMNRGLAAYAVVLFIPSVMLNSAAWGQCDVIFTLFILASVYCLLLGKDWGAVICFSVSFVFKIQAVFFAPVLLIMLLKGKIRFRTCAAFPAVYLISIIPALLTGGDFLRLLTVYFRQAKQYSSLNMHLPNAWGLLTGVKSDELSSAGVMFAGGVVLIAIFWIYRSEFKITDRFIVAVSAMFTLLVPYVLPHMHERYFYLPTVLTAVFAVCMPRKIWMFLIMEFCSFQVTSWYLFRKDTMDFNFLVILVTAVLASYFKILYDMMKASSCQPA